MKISATTNQLGLAPMRIPKTRASWIDPVRIHTHGGRRAQGGAPRADSLAMRLPPPAACLGSATCVSRSSSASASARSSRSTAAIIAVDVDNVKGLESAHNRVTKGVVPRVIAAQRAEAAFADLHFAQTSMVLTGGKHARGRDGRPRCRKTQAVAALRKTDRDAGSAKRVAVVADAIKTWNVLDAKLYARRQARRHRLRRADRRRLRGRRGRQRRSPPSSATSRRPTAIARRPTSASPRWRAATRRSSIVIGVLALLAALGLAVGLARHLGRRLRAVSQAAEALAQGDVDHELSVERPRRGRAHRRLLWPRWSSTCARWPAPPTRVAAGDLTVDVQPRSERDRLGAAFAGLVAELRAAVTPDVALGHQRRRRLRARRILFGGRRPCGRGDRTRSGRRRRRRRAPGALDRIGARHDRAGRKLHHQLRVRTRSRPRTPPSQAREAAQGRRRQGRARHRGHHRRARRLDPGQRGHPRPRHEEPAHRRDRRHHQRDRRADQPAGAQRCHRGRPRRRARSRFRRRRRRGPQAGRGVAARGVLDRRGWSTRSGPRPSARSPSSKPAPSAASWAPSRSPRLARPSTGIFESVEVVSKRVGGVSAAVEQIAAGAAQVSGDISEVAAVAEESSATVQQVSASAEETSASTQQIAALRPGPVAHRPRARRARRALHALRGAGGGHRAQAVLAPGAPPKAGPPAGGRTISAVCLYTGGV